jgi:hypothetical protein
MAAMVYVDCREWIGLGENVGDAVAVAGLHGRQCRSVISPRAGIFDAGMAIRVRRHERRLLPLTL